MNLRGGAYFPISGMSVVRLRLYDHTMAPGTGRCPIPQALLSADTVMRVLVISLQRHPAGVHDVRSDYLNLPAAYMYVFVDHVKPCANKRSSVQPPGSRQAW
jgi:hypothetical protein